MVQIATLVGEVTRLKNELERVDALRKESETSLSRAVSPRLSDMFARRPLISVLTGWDGESTTLMSEAISAAISRVSP